MHVFVTGSTGFIGTAVVKDLILGGHSVTGLTRSDAGSEQLKSQGATPIRGDIEDVSILKKAASEADAVVHLAFIHDFADMAGACAKDQAAITAMGETLAAKTGDRALVTVSGTMMLQPGEVRSESDPIDLANPFSAARGASEALCHSFAKQGVRASVVRLPPATYAGDGSSGLMMPFISIALQKGQSAYVEGVDRHWSAGHRDDAAALFRLAVEKGRAGAVYHAAAEEGLSLKSIATEVGKQLDVPVVWIRDEQVDEYFTWFGFGMKGDSRASSEQTKRELGWEPKGAGLLEETGAIVDFVKMKGSAWH